ncbi:hypothetical protein ACFX1X_033312 [Malus domestica]
MVFACAAAKKKEQLAEQMKDFSKNMEDVIIQRPVILWSMSLSKTGDTLVDKSFKDRWYLVNDGRYLSGRRPRIANMRRNPRHLRPTRLLFFVLLLHLKIQGARSCWNCENCLGSTGAAVACVCADGTLSLWEEVAKDAQPLQWKLYISFNSGSAQLLDTQFGV